MLILYANVLCFLVTSVGYSAWTMLANGSSEKVPHYCGEQGCGIAGNHWKWSDGAHSNFKSPRQMRAVISIVVCLFYPIGLTLGVAYLYVKLMRLVGGKIARRLVRAEVSRQIEPTTYRS